MGKKEKNSIKDVLFTWDAPDNFTGVVRLPGNIIKTFADGKLNKIKYSNGVEKTYE